MSLLRKVYLQRPGFSIRGCAGGVNKILVSIYNLAPSYVACYMYS